MKKLFFLPLLLLGLAAYSQTDIFDPATLRTRINTQIITNGTKQITGAQLNKILNGVLNIWPTFSNGLTASNSYPYTVKLGGNLNQNTTIGGLSTYDLSLVNIRNFTLSATSVQMNLGSDVTGDIYVRGPTGKLIRLGPGTNGQVLTMAAGMPAWVNSAGGSATPTLQQVFTAGSLLSFNNTIAGNGTSIYWQNFSDFNVISSHFLAETDIQFAPGQFSVTQLNLTSFASLHATILGGTHTSEVNVYPDSVLINLSSLKYLKIHSLAAVWDTAKKIMVWDPVLERVSYFPYWPAFGTGGGGVVDRPLYIDNVIKAGTPVFDTLAIFPTDTTMRFKAFQFNIGSSKLSLTRIAYGDTAVSFSYDVVEANINRNNLFGTLNAAGGGTGFSSYTKGDILVATSATAFIKVAVGNNNDVLTADNTTASGVKWAPGGGGGGGTPGGINQQVQYNNVGVFAGSNLKYDNANGHWGLNTPPVATWVLDILGNIHTSGEIQTATTISTGSGIFQSGVYQQATASAPYFRYTSTWNNLGSFEWYGKDGTLGLLRLSGSGTGSVIIPPLAGNGSGFVAVDNLGTLSWVATPSGGVSDGDKGDIVVSAGGTVWTVDNNVVSNAKLSQMPALSVKANATNATANASDIVASSDNTAFLRSGTTLTWGTITTAYIGDAAITYAKIQNVSGSRLLGRYSVGAGPAQEISIGSGLSFDPATGILSSTGGSGLSGLTAGNIPVATSGSTLGPTGSTSANGLFWNNTLNRLGINVASPTYNLQVGGNFFASASIETQTSLSVGTTIFQSSIYSQGGGTAPWFEFKNSWNNLGAFRWLVLDGATVAMELGSDRSLTLAGYASGLTAPSTTGTNHMVTVDANGKLSHQVIPVGGSVTSVDVSFSAGASAIFSATGGPITTSGTIVLQLVSQSAHTFYSGPTSGASAAPTFRTLVTADYPDASVTLAKMANLGNQLLIGRNTAGTGVPEAISISQVLDWLGSAQGSVLYRDATTWAVLAPGTDGQLFTTHGAGANPTWTTVTGGSGISGLTTGKLDYASSSTTIASTGGSSSINGVAWNDVTNQLRINLAPGSVVGYTLEVGGVIRSTSTIRAEGNMVVGSVLSAAQAMIGTGSSTGMTEGSALDVLYNNSANGISIGTIRLNQTTSSTGVSIALEPWLRTTHPSGTVADVRSFVSVYDQGSSNPVTEARVGEFTALMSNTTGGTIAVLKMVQADISAQTSTTTTVTQGYAFYYGGKTGSGTVNFTNPVYAFYNNDASAQNYFKGRTFFPSLGTTTSDVLAGLQASSGDMANIAIGTGLSLSGNTLSVSGVITGASNLGSGVGVFFDVNGGNTIRLKSLTTPTDGGITITDNGNTGIDLKNNGYDVYGKNRVTTSSTSIFTGKFFNPLPADAAGIITVEVSGIRATGESFFTIRQMPWRKVSGTCTLGSETILRANEQIPTSGFGTPTFSWNISANHPELDITPPSSSTTYWNVTYKISMAINNL